MPDVDQALPPAVPQPGEHPSDYCGPCKSGKHAKCYEPCLCRDRGHGAPVSPRTLPVTPAERALAAFVRAWDEWPGIAGERAAEDVIWQVGRVLKDAGLVHEDNRLLPAGAALLARVEAADAQPSERAAIVAYVAAEEAKQRRDSKDPTHYDADTDRCITRAYILAAVGRRIERGDHLTTPIDAPPAKEPAPLVSIRACKHPRASGDCYSCPDCGVINNCNLENGEPEAECQMCPGKCPNRAQYAAKEPR